MCRVLSLGQNVMDFVDKWFILPMQEHIYLGFFFFFFCGIETYDMSVVGDDGIVRSMSIAVVFFLDPPPIKRPPGRPRKKRIES